MAAISHRAIRNTLQSLTAAGLQAASLAVGSVDQIDASDESFDAILCIGVLDCAGAARLSAALGEIVRVLRPGGSALAVFASDKDFRCQGANPLQIHGFSDDEVKDAVSAACANAKAVWTDRFITTYENMKIQQNEHLLTIIK